MGKYVYEVNSGWRVEKQSKQLGKTIYVGQFNDKGIANGIAQVFGAFIDHVPQHRYLAFSQKWPPLIYSQVHHFRLAYGGLHPDISQTIIPIHPLIEWPFPPELPGAMAPDPEIFAYVNEMILFAKKELDVLKAKDESNQEN